MELLFYSDGLFDEMFSILAGLPYYKILIIALVGYVIGLIWYGRLFLRKWMRLMGKSDNEPTNIPAMVIQFFEMLLISYFIALTFYSTTFAVALLIFDAFIGIVLFSILTAQMFTYNNNRKAVKLWGIHLGFYVVAFAIMAGLFLIW